MTAVINVCLLSMLIGFVSSTLAKMVDSWLDYGKILSFVRYRIFKRYATPDDEVELIDIQESNIGYDEQVGEVHDVYKRIAGRHHMLALLLCVQCMSFHFVYITIIMAVSLGISLPLSHWLGIFVLSLCVNERLL
jgi:hypothetical protein